MRATLRRLLETGVNTVCAKLVPRLRSALNVFEGASSLIQYQLADEAFAAASEGLNAFATEFLPVLSSIVAPYQYALTPPLSLLVVAHVAAYVARQLEHRVRRKKFNQLGGLQFDRDIRALVNFFTARAGRTVRGRFGRLLQVAQLVNLEAPTDVLDLWNSGGSGGRMNWEITADEVRAILSLRADFNQQVIQRLALDAK